MPIKVLFVSYKLMSYRIPIFERIGSNDDIDLTILHSGKHSGYVTSSFKEEIIDFKKVGPFTYYNDSFKKYVANSDAVVCMFYLMNLSFIKLALRRKRSYKLLYWGIGVRASYNSEFDSPTAMNYLRYFIAGRSDAMLFYSQYAKEKYVKKGINPEKIFVMPNTVEVLPKSSTPIIKTSIIFIGTLYKQKKIFELLDAYKYALERMGNSVPKLEIVGDGAEFENIKNWIGAEKLTTKIELHGAIYEEKELKKLFEKSYACISPGQAGLSVLKSFGYGVPFITHRNAITGGERLNIKDGVNGCFFDDYNELKDIIINLTNEKDKYIKMGENAKQFYDSERTPDVMANGFISAISFTTKK
ncbi:glycosyltransferase family 4 protein [Maribacter sp. 2307ULW6-5]|uniref:glycosyltransferase family 4 protein n=1 Tax=Maribacter sp. 2307ULW6-5 TaxID=3386275 RepID=UPI0039BD0426